MSRPASDLTIHEYLEQLSSDRPTPGGGSAAAVVGALGAAAAAMVANFTLGREKFAEVAGDVQRLLVELEDERNRLADLAQADIEAYEQVAEALKRPKKDPERAEALQEALRAAADVPLQALSSCVTIARLLPELAEKGNPNLLSDVGVASECARCAARCAALNVEVNLAYMKDAEYVAARREEKQQKLDEVERLADQVFQTVLERVQG